MTPAEKVVLFDVIFDIVPCCTSVPPCSDHVARASVGGGGVVWCYSGAALSADLNGTLIRHLAEHY